LAQHQRPTFDISVSDRRFLQLLRIVADETQEEDIEV
jgi:hypothetical protein